jgi:hypothetical protein
MRHFVYFFPCIAPLVAVAVATAITTLMYLSPIPPFFLNCLFPSFLSSLVFLVLRFALVLHYLSPDRGEG